MNKETMKNMAATKNGREFQQVAVAALAVGVILLLKDQGVLVINQFATAVLGGLAAYIGLAVVQRKQKETLLSTVDEGSTSDHK